MDEEWSLRLSESAPESLATYWRSESHPPLYYLLLGTWTHLFGDAEAAARSLSALLGVLSVLATYLLGSRLFGREAGLAGAAIIALSAFHVALSQEARMYGLLVLLSLLSAYFALRVSEEGTPLVVTAYAAITALLLYTHLYGVFVVLGENLFLLWRWRSSRIHAWLLGQSAVALLFSPWLLVLFLQAKGMSSGAFVNIGWIASPTLADLVRTPALWTYYSPLLALLLVALAAVAATGRTMAPQGHQGLPPSRDGAAFLILLILSSVLVPFVFSLLAVPLYQPRYTAAAAAFLAVLAGAGLVELKARWRLTAYAAGAAILLLSAASLLAYSHAPSPEPWREVAALVSEGMEPGDEVLVSPAFAEPSLRRYLGPDAEVLADHKEVSATRVWSVIREPYDEPPLSGYESIAESSLGDLKVVLLVKGG